MLNKFYTISFLILILCSCDNSEVVSISENLVDEPVIETNLDWLSGTWMDSTSFKMMGRIYMEEWEMIEEDNYKGKKYSIKKGVSGDTTRMKIDKSEGKLYYTIFDKDDRYVFVQTKGSSNEIEFANTKDEFPYTINYLNTKEKLTIIASGSLNGVERKIIFNTLKQ